MSRREGLPEGLPLALALALPLVRFLFWKGNAEQVSGAPQWLTRVLPYVCSRSSPAEALLGLLLEDRPRRGREVAGLRDRLSERDTERK